MEQDFGPFTDYAEDGVDLTLIRSFLLLTPAERIAYNDAHVSDIFAMWEHLGVKPLDLDLGQ